MKLDLPKLKTKVCEKCKKEKFLKQFSGIRRSKIYNNTCKECNLEKTKSQRYNIFEKNNKETIKKTFESIKEQNEYIKKHHTLFCMKQGKWMGEEEAREYMGIRN